MKEFRCPEDAKSYTKCLRGISYYMITTAQKIMLIVDKKTASALNRACGCARYAYNWARDTWFAKKAAGHKSVTCAELRKEFNAQKADWMYESPKGSMDQAIKNFVLAKYGTLLLKVGRFFSSSKKCSGCGHTKEKLSLSEREFICEECGLVIDRDTNAAINILAEALFLELNKRFNTDIARRKFTPADLVALATSLSRDSETTEDEAHRLLTRDGRTAVVDGFFNRLWNQVANATVKN